MWKEVLERLIVSFAFANPDAYFYYLCHKHQSLSGSETHQVLGSSSIEVLRPGRGVRAQKLTDPRARQGNPVTD